MDLDGDGQLDLISGSWPGELYFFKGKGNGQYADPNKLKNKAGKTINVGGGVMESPGTDYFLVAGDAKIEKTDKGTVIFYDGERIPVPEGKQAATTGTASAPHAFDWNRDGKIDLLVGQISGTVAFLPNEGTATEWAFGKEQLLHAAGQPIRANRGDSHPFVADWDGDNQPDLFVGAGDGSVWFYRNVGRKDGLPELAAGVQLVPPGEATHGPEAPREPRRGIRAKICVTDFNGDGRLDLLVGDFATQKPDRPEPTAEEKAAQEKLRAELKSVQARWRELHEKIRGPKRVTDKQELDKLQKELTTVGSRMSELYRQLPPEYENHGWVWLFLRRPNLGRAVAQ